MLDDPKDSLLPEPPEGPAEGSGIPPEPSGSVEMPAGEKSGMLEDITPGLERPADDHSILETSQPVDGEETPPSRLGTGSLFQRLTGTLRKVTGSLRDTGALPPLESEPNPETGQLKRADSIMSRHLNDETPVPEEHTVTFEPVVFEEGEPIPMPESRRQVPDSGIITASLPELEEKPETGPVAEPGAGHPPSESESGPPRSGTGNLIQRVTGTLRKVTGTLRDTGGLKSPDSQPAQEAGPTGRLPEKKRPAGPDYVSDLRKTLTSEDEADRAKRSTGSLVQRITGRLRRITGSLRATDALPPKETVSTPPETIQPETIQSEIGDDFLTDRLAVAQSNELPTLEESQPIQMPASWGEQPDWGPDSGIEAAELLEMEEDQPAGTKPETEILLGDDEPITLLESGAIAALGRAEDASQEEEPDWMAEIRREAQTAGLAEEQPPAPTLDETGIGFEPGPEQPVVDQRDRPSTTGNLRSIITGILGISAEKDKPPAETEFPDEMVTGRLGRSLGIEAPQAPEMQPEDLIVGEEIYPPTETSQAPGFDAGEATEQPPLAGEADLFYSEAAEESPLLEGLEVSFSRIEGVEDYTKYDLQPEDEQILWGEYTTGDGATAGEEIITEFPQPQEDIWGNDQPGYTAFGADLRREIWGEEIEPEIPEERDRSAKPEEYIASDEYAAAYLTGEELVVEGEVEEGLPDQPAGEEQDISAQDLRSIALEDYEEGEFDYDAYKPTIDWGDEVVETTAVAEPVTVEEKKEPLRAEVKVEEYEEPVVARDWRTWLASRKTAHKLLLAEGALVILAILVAVPFFVFMILRGPVRQAGPVIQNQLPAGVAYPTGLTLPGGWYFPLETSTIVNGKWQPTTSEWLMGTELRRVIALPWNRQTEAVIKTFQSGDPVEIQLSDYSTLNYKITAIERVPVGNTKILSDTRPSLVIILYNEKDPSRWVVIANP